VRALFPENKVRFARANARAGQLWITESRRLDMNAWRSVLAASCVNDLSRVGADGRNQSDRGPPHVSDSDSFELITTPRR